MSKLLRLGVLLLLGFPLPMQAEIPKTIHQIWIGEQLPAYMEMVRQRFIELNPGQCIASSPEALLNHPDDTRIIPAQNTFGETIYMLYPCPHYPDSLAVNHFDFVSSWYEEEE